MTMASLTENILLIAVGVTSLGASAIAQVPVKAGDVVTFITCPVYRDTDAGRKSGCWLGDDRESGVRYDITPSPTKPLSEREVLVEGMVGEATDACGGIELTPARVSVLPGRCTANMLPAEGYPGRPYKLPSRNVRPSSESRDIDVDAEAKTFYMFFDFNRDFLVYQLDDFFLDEAVAYIRAAHPSEIVVTGYGATENAMVSGRPLSETRDIAEQRARRITRALVELGIAETIIRTKWVNNAQPVGVEAADGLPYASRRRVEILVTP